MQDWIPSPSTCIRGGIRMEDLDNRFDFNHMNTCWIIENVPRLLGWLLLDRTRFWICCKSSLKYCILLPSAWWCQVKVDLCNYPFIHSQKHAFSQCPWPYVILNQNIYFLIFVSHWFSNFQTLKHQVPVKNYFAFSNYTMTKSKLQEHSNPKCSWKASHRLYS